MSAFLTEKAILSHFALKGEVLSLTPCTVGLINTTFFVHTEGADYVLQRINTEVFKKPDEVMANIDRITAHLTKKGVPTLHFVKTTDGALFYQDDSGVWRVSVREVGTTHNTLTEELFEKAACAFGRFQSALADFDAGLLYETIPDFHNTKKRLSHLFESAERDAFSRADTCSELLAFCRLHEQDAGLLVDALASGEIPLRVVHNDTKVNNVLFDENGVGLVLDLDTVMPGSLLFDFGDAVRSGAATRPEGDPDFRNTALDKTLYTAFLKGFLSGCGNTLTEKERALLPHSVFVIAFELGCRFLDDYLCGDTYFRTTYDGENLVRAKGQFALAADVYARLSDLSVLTDRLI